MTGATNLIINGQTLNTNSNRRDQNNFNFSSLSDINIYQQCCMDGVYMIDGSEGQVSYIYPISFSYSDIAGSGIYRNTDDAYLVYPGFGFQLFTGTSYSGTKSCIYYNTGTQPYVFVLGTTNWPGAAKRVYKFGYDNINGYQYINNSTKSILIFFRGNTITVSGG